MSKVTVLILLALALSACAHHQPKARCTGPLERINIPGPASTSASSLHQEAAPNEEPKDEEGEL